MALEVEVALRRDLAEERTLDATEFVVAEVEEVWRRDLVEEHALGVVRLEVLEAEEVIWCMQGDWRLCPLWPS